MEKGNKLKFQSYLDKKESIMLILCINCVAWISNSYGEGGERVCGQRLH